jgi:tRNA(fMet)-specific endonuclease VapC
MSRYMLDTNMASHVMRGDIKAVREHLDRAALGGEMALSVISQAELFYGWARRGHPEALGKLIGAFLGGVDVMPWTQAVARCYGDLRAMCEAGGVNLTTSDMMIAAHAKAVGAVLVTRDKAFQHIKHHLAGLEDWTAGG